MRISSAGALLLLAACSAGADGEVAADPANSIECALGGSSVFKRECVLELTQVDDAQSLTVRHPDGGFRRFELQDDGVVTADGFEDAQVETREGRIDVSVGADRYRFPTTITGDDRE